MMNNIIIIYMYMALYSATEKCIFYQVPKVKLNIFSHGEIKLEFNKK